MEFVSVMTVISSTSALTLQFGVLMYTVMSKISKVSVRVSAVVAVGVACIFPLTLQHAFYTCRFDPCNVANSSVRDGS